MSFASQFSSQRHWRHEMLHDWIPRNSSSYPLPFGPRIRRVCRCRFRTISFLIQAPRKANDRAGIYEHIPHLSVNCIHIFLYFLSSLHIDMKMILSIKFSGSHCWSLIRLWIFSGRPNVVIPVDIFHSNSVGIPSIRFISLKWLFSEYHLILLFQAAILSSPFFPTQSTESEKT